MTFMSGFPHVVNSIAAIRHESPFAKSAPVGMPIPVRGIMFLENTTTEPATAVENVTG